MRMGTDMRFKTFDSSFEKRMLVGMIMSDTFIKKVKPVFDLDYLDLSAVKKVSEWVLDYYGAYGRAPKAVIQDIFSDKVRTLKEEDVEWIEGFLSKLSEDYEKEGFNESYLFDETTKYFRRQRMLRSAKGVQDLIERGKDEQAQQLWTDSMLLPDDSDLGVDPFNEEDVQRMYEKEQVRASMGIGVESIDEMVGPVKAGWLAVFLGPMKRGKTFALIHVAVKAMFKGYNVVFISLETEDFDNSMRMWMNLGSFSSDGRLVRYPYYTDKKKMLIDYREIERPQPTLQEVLSLVRRMRKSGMGNLRVKTYPMGVAGIKEIKAYLDLLEVVKGYSPHVIVVDYIGAMSSPTRLIGNDSEYNYNSRMLKALAKERQAVVFSGHQATRDSLEKWSLKAGDTSQEIRLFANIDVMYGLNQTDSEMDKGVMRMNVIGHRHQKFTRNKQGHLLQAFAAGQFVLDDTLIDVKGKNREEYKKSLKSREEKK